MDFWSFILAAACLGTFILEVWGFWKIIQLIVNIKDGLGISENGAFDTGHMLTSAVISIGLTLGEVDEKGKPTPRNEELQQALGNIFGFGAAVLRAQFMGANGEIDATKIPKKYQGYLAIAQTLGLDKVVAGFLQKGSKKVVESAVEGMPGW